MSTKGNNQLSLLPLAIQQNRSLFFRTNLITFDEIKKWPTKKKRQDLSQHRRRNFEHNWTDHQHPFVQTIIHKDKLSSIIYYTDHPLDIDRTFNVGAYYATVIVYKNTRLGKITAHLLFSWAQSCCTKMTRLKRRKALWKTWSQKLTVRLHPWKFGECPVWQR